MVGYNSRCRFVKKFSAMNKKERINKIYEVCKFANL